jgi:hypothetical protein
MSSIKILYWKDIVEKINNAKEKRIEEQEKLQSLLVIKFINKDTINKYYKYAEEYYKNFYNGDNIKMTFSKNEVKNIVEEIIDEAEHKLRLFDQDEQQKKFKKEYPNFDTYIDNIFNRGAYRY